MGKWRWFRHPPLGSATSRKPPSREETADDVNRLISIAMGGAGGDGVMVASPATRQRHQSQTTDKERDSKEEWGDTRQEMGGGMNQRERERKRTRATSISHPAKSSSSMKKSSVAMLKAFWRLPRYSPIICLLTPFRDMKNLATARGAFSRKPCTDGQLPFVSDLLAWWLIGRLGFNGRHVGCSNPVCVPHSFFFSPCISGHRVAEPSVAFFKA